MTAKRKTALPVQAGTLGNTVSKNQANHTTPPLTPQASWHTCGNSAADQRERLLAAIHERGSISTFESRRDLDIMHPSARIMELKKRGEPIQTVRVPEVSPAGKVHNVARYYLASEAGKVGL